MPFSHLDASNDDADSSWRRRFGWMYRDRVRQNAKTHGITRTTAGVTGSYHSEREYGPMSSGELQRTVDQNHATGWYVKRRMFHGKWFKDVGGPFVTEHQVVSDPWVGNHTWRQGGRYATVSGPLHTSGTMRNHGQQIANGNEIPSTLVRLSDIDLLGHGATGIARTLPTAPEMSLITSVAELREGLPRLIGAQAYRERSLSSLGGEYLNYQFGIVPLVGDVQDILRLTGEYEKIITQFRRDQGKLVRRRTTLVDEEETTITKPANGWTYPTSIYARNFTRETRRRERVWFSGAYKMAYPLGLNKALDDIIEFNRVYGVIPNGEVAWNLLPFSWLVDWFSNVGDVVRNASLLGNNLQLAYGYVMGETSEEIVERGDFIPTDGLLARSVPLHLEQSRTHTRKRRLKASPLGFSVNFDGLTPYQGSILAALGISRLSF